MEYIIGLFLRTIKVSTTDRYEYIKELRMLTQTCLTMIGSSFYVYMLFLERSDRKDESELMKKYRTEIFALRDDFPFPEDDDRVNFNVFTEKHIEKIINHLKLLREKIDIQVLMLRSGMDDRRWEESIFQSVTNDICGLMYKLGNDLNYDQQIK